MKTRSEIIHALREHGSECAEWVYQHAANLLEQDAVILDVFRAEAAERAAEDHQNLRD